MRIPIGYFSRRCSCGALTQPETTRCTKCRDRARWVRRKAPRSGL